MYSDVQLFYSNQKADYDTECLTGIRLSRKFSAIIYFRGSGDKLVEYLKKFFLVNDEYFDVFLAVDTPGYDIKRIKILFPSINVIQFMRSSNFAKRMNVFMKIVKSEYFLLIDDNFILQKIDVKFLDKLLSSYKKPVCATPVIFDEDGEVYPSIRIPQKSDKMSVSVAYSFPVLSVQNTFFPVRGIGVYSKQRLITLGEFEDMPDYYSILDYSIRQWCYGFSCTYCDSLSAICKNVDSLVEEMDNSQMYNVNLNAYWFRKQGESVPRVNFSSLLCFDYKDVRRASATKKDYIYDYDMLIKNWILYEDECLKTLKGVV